MIHSHQSLTTSYIADYINLTHQVYPSFITRMSTTYYSLDVPNSNMNEDLLSIYNDVSNPNHGGRYNVIYNLPVHSSTNSSIADNANEKGINVNESSNIQVNIDPLVNIVPKIGDLISFNTQLSNYFGVYRVTNIEVSATLFAPYTKVSLELVPNITTESLRSFVIEELAFVTNYHHIFKKGDTLLIISLQKKIDELINYFNSIYNHQLDAHVDYDHHVFLDFEKALNSLFIKYTNHTNMLKIDKCFLCDNLLSYYNDDNIFIRMLSPNKPIDTNSTIMYTSSIRRLDKTRRRSINNKVAIYRLLNPNNNKDKLILESPLGIKKQLNLDTIIPYSDRWSNVISDSFINNVKDAIDRFIRDDCVIDERNMFSNAIKLAQVFYIIDHIIKKNIKNYPTDNNLGIIQHS